MDSGDGNYLNGSIVTAPSSGHITSLSVYVGPIDSTAANRLYQVAAVHRQRGQAGNARRLVDVRDGHRQCLEHRIDQCGRPGEREVRG